MYSKKSLTTILLLAIGTHIIPAQAHDKYWSELPPVSVKNRIALFNSMQIPTQNMDDLKPNDVKILGKHHVQNMRSMFESPKNPATSQEPVDAISVTKFATKPKITQVFATHISTASQEPVDATSVTKFATKPQITQVFATHISTASQEPVDATSVTKFAETPKISQVKSGTVVDQAVIPTGATSLTKEQIKKFNGRLDQVLHTAKSLADQLNLPEVPQTTSPAKKERIHRHKSRINLQEKLDHILNLARQVETNLNNDKPVAPSLPVPSEQNQLHKQAIDLLLQKMKNITVYEDEDELDSNFDNLPPVVIPTTTQEQYLKQINDLQERLQKTTNRIERGKMTTTLFNLNLRLKELQNVETKPATSFQTQILDLNKVTAALSNKFLTVNHNDDNDDNSAWENDEFGINA